MHIFMLTLFKEMASFDSKSHESFVNNTQKRYQKYKDLSNLMAQTDILKAEENKRKVTVPNLADLVPPMVVNPAQKHFLKFWFGTNNTDNILQNRQLIYNGQLNAQCPNFDDPDATVPYINFATQKLECRVPNPQRTAKDDTTICPNGLNPFAIEKYVKNDGSVVCRVPVTRGKWFCVEPPHITDSEEVKKRYENASDQYKGNHVTLPDGTGICVPPPDVNPHKPKEKEDFRK
jgi:hypothetical protein